ncbi:MAG TPA: hypothetical protein VER08_00520, partial [Pyrinomonadaceae bacterium]|nr:hypothetical protein [Pyrinomonadaceae bacterium]
MRKLFFFALLLAGLAPATPAQVSTQPAPRQSPAAQTPAGQRPSAPQQQPQRPPASLDPAEYGVRIEPEPRLIVMMAALEAAGLELTPQGSRPSPFRTQVRGDLAGLDADLRARMQTFFRRHRLPDPATPAEQAARYVSLAYVLGPPPAFELPARTDDLPGGVLEVLDFAPLVREFYRRSGVDERLPEYVRAAHAVGTQMRPAAVEMVRSVLTYLHTRPQLTYLERAPAPPSPASGDRGRQQQRNPVMHERERTFRLVPDLLAAPGAINFRVIGDDYYAIVPAGASASSPELRRAYLQFVVDPLVLRFNREVAARRAEIRALLDAERARAKSDITVDPFIAVARSLVAAADARMTEAPRIEAATARARSLLASAKTDAERAAVTKEMQEEQRAAQDATAAQLA